MPEPCGERARRPSRRWRRRRYGGIDVAECCEERSGPWRASIAVGRSRAIAGTLARVSHPLVSEGLAGGSTLVNPPAAETPLLDDRFGLGVEEVDALGHERHPDLLVGPRLHRRLHPADHRLSAHAHVEQDL